MSYLAVQEPPYLSEVAVLLHKEVQHGGLTEEGEVTLGERTLGAR